MKETHPSDDDSTMKAYYDITNEKGLASAQLKL